MKLLTAKYLNNGNLWSASVIMKQSWVWKGVLLSRDIVKEGFCFLVGNGMSISVWNQSWIPYITTFKPQPLAPSVPQMVS